MRVHHLESVISFGMATGSCTVPAFRDLYHNIIVMDYPCATRACLALDPSKWAEKTPSMAGPITGPLYQ